MFKQFVLATIVSASLVGPAYAQNFLDGVNFGPGGVGGNWGVPGGGQFGVSGIGNGVFGNPLGGMGQRGGASQGFGAPNQGGDVWHSSGSGGAQNRWSDTTDTGARQASTPNQVQMTEGGTFNTGKQTLGNGGSSMNGPQLPPTMTTQYGTAPGEITPLNALPPTVLDSFVKTSGNADAIYGDEGQTGPPPINGFEYENTIGSGIQEDHLSTGHASTLPSAWLTNSDLYSGGIDSGGDFAGLGSLFGGGGGGPNIGGIIKGVGGIMRGGGFPGGGFPGMGGGPSYGGGGGGGGGGGFPFPGM